MTTPTVDPKMQDLNAEIAKRKIEVTTNVVAPAKAPEGYAAWWTTTSAMTVCSVVLVFGLVVFLLVSSLLRAGKDGEVILRVFGTILVVIFAVFLVVAGYSDTQIAPVMGLLGTIAGYLLGRGSANRPPTADKPGTPKADPTPP